jgi:hypothetical protein
MSTTKPGNLQKFGRNALRSELSMPVTRSTVQSNIGADAAGCAPARPGSNNKADTMMPMVDLIERE